MEDSRTDGPRAQEHLQRAIPVREPDEGATRQHRDNRAELLGKADGPQLPACAGARLLASGVNAQDGVSFDRYALL